MKLFRPNIGQKSPISGISLTSCGSCYKLCIWDYVFDNWLLFMLSLMDI